MRRADGEYRWVPDNGVPRFEPSGTFVGYIGSGVDITDLKSAHEEHLARQKLETVGALASGIAHDFNNLLGGVLAHSELALAELASGSPPLDKLQSIRFAATRGAEIVRQLMVYAGEETEVHELVDIFNSCERQARITQGVHVETGVSRSGSQLAASKSACQSRSNPASCDEPVL